MSSITMKVGKIGGVYRSLRYTSQTKSFTMKGITNDNGIKKDITEGNKNQESNKLNNEVS